MHHENEDTETRDDDNDDCVGVGMTKKKQSVQSPYEGDADKRIIEKMLREKNITPGELQAYIDDIPDVSDNAEEFTVELNKRYPSC